jgi:hypothetical protein
LPIFAAERCGEPVPQWREIAAFLRGTEELAPNEEVGLAESY